MVSSSRSRVGAAVCRVGVAAVLVTGLAAGAVGAVDAPGPVTPASSIATSGVPGRTVALSDEGVRARPSGARAAAPGQVEVGARIVVSGVVKVRPRRTRVVVLQQQSDSGAWVALTSVRTTRGGVFRMTTSAGSEVTTRTLRVHAPRAPRLPRYSSSPMTVRVVAPPVAGAPTPSPSPSPTPAPSNPAPTTPAPTAPSAPAPGWDPAEAPAPGQTASAGSASDWSFLFDGGGRWNPCTTIDWAYDASGSYTGSLQDMTRAFARLAGRTGLHFRYAGAVDTRTTGDASPAGVEIVVSWATAAEVPDLAGSVVGIGGSSGTSMSGADVRYRLVSGRIHLDSEGALRPGFTTTGDPTWGQIMEHEALHVLGLGHAASRSQLMYGAAHSGNHLVGAGDAAGMKRIGADQGCLR